MSKDKWKRYLKIIKTFFSHFINSRLSFSVYHFLFSGPKQVLPPPSKSVKSIPFPGGLQKMALKSIKGLKLPWPKPTQPGVLAEGRYRLFHEMTRAGPMWPSPELKNCAPGKKWRPLPAAMSIHWSVKLLQPKKNSKQKISVIAVLYFSHWIFGHYYLFRVPTCCTVLAALKIKSAKLELIRL